jgi:hypothetical protein
MADPWYDPQNKGGKGTFDELFGRNGANDAKHAAIVAGFGGGLSKSWFGGTDAPVIDEAVSMMFSMCANSGQISIVSDGENGFRDWASQVIEQSTNTSILDSGDAGDIPDLLGNLDISGEALEATSVIWGKGAGKVQEYAAQQQKEAQAANIVQEVADIVGGPLGDLVGAVGKLFGFLGSVFD